MREKRLSDKAAGSDVDSRMLRARLAPWMRHAILLATPLLLGVHERSTAQEPMFAPGQRALLDAHNAYPERGVWTDRLPRALATGIPLAIEQDLYWGRDSSGSPAVVVAHDEDALEGAPTLTAFFFETVRPLMEQAIRENQRETWPLLVLNLDFKQDTAPLLDGVWEILDQHRAWLTTATRAADPAIVQPLRVGPMMVLVGSAEALRRRYHDAVPAGDPLLAFGAMSPVRVPGRTKGARFRASLRMRAEEHIPRAADNYARWVNFPWSVIEQGGQNQAGRWTGSDSTRLQAFARRAHTMGYWLRVYTLDGFTDAENRGWTSSYNLGSLEAARVRWRAARHARVDFIATDQYEAFAADRSASVTNTGQSSRSAPERR